MKMKKRRRRNKMFEIIPSVLLVDGHLAIVRGDEYEYLEDEDGLLVSPGDFVEFISENYERLLVADIDGIFKNNPNLEVVRSMCERGSIWVDAGVRFYEHIMDVIVCGAERAIASTKTVFSMKELSAMLNFGDILSLCIDYDDGIVAYDKQIGLMSVSTLADKAADLGFNELIFYDIGRALGKKLAEGPIHDAIHEDLPVYVAGVLPEDVDKLKKMGCRGAIISVKHILEEA